MKSLALCIFTIITIGLLGCETGRESSRGFSLPKGNLENGQLVYVKYQCSSCHELSNFTSSENILKHPELSIPLGGKTRTVKTYAALLTSVINPSHKFSNRFRKDIKDEDGQSKMKVYNDVMTVTELVDLVTFLESKYELEPYTRAQYQHYDYRGN